MQHAWCVTRQCDVAAGFAAVYFNRRLLMMNMNDVVVVVVVTMIMNITMMMTMMTMMMTMVMMMTHVLSTL